MAKLTRILMMASKPPTPAPTPLVDQLVSAGVALSNIYAYGPRRLYSGADYAYKVRRSTDDATVDVGFDSQGNLKLSTIGAHVGSATGTAQILYDQTGNGANLTTANTSRELQLLSGNSFQIAGDANRPTLLVTAVDNGYVATLPSSLSTATNSAFMVASMSNQTTTSVPRFLSLLTNLTTGDTASASTGLLICRNSSSSPAPIWAINRVGSIKGQVTGEFDRLDQIATIHDGTNATIWLNNFDSNGSGSTGAFSATRLAIGLSGSLFSMLPGARISELIFLRVGANETIRNLIHENQAAYYGLP